MNDGNQTSTELATELAEERTLHQETIAALRELCAWVGRGDDDEQLGMAYRAAREQLEKVAS